MPNYYRTQPEPLNTPLVCSNCKCINWGKNVKYLKIVYLICNNWYVNKRHTSAKEVKAFADIADNVYPYMINYLIHLDLIERPYRGYYIPSEITDFRRFTTEIKYEFERIPNGN
jgi:hypothetical protein